LRNRARATPFSNDTVRRAAVAVLAHILVIVIWYVVVEYGHVPHFVMPSPVATIKSLGGENNHWLSNTAVTSSEIFGGYALAVIVGIALAIVFTWSKPVEAAVMPLLVSLNMIPKVALGPLFIVWFSYGIMPNTIIAFSISFFPILLTTARGFREVEPDLLDLVRSLRGSRWQLFTKIATGRAALYIFWNEGGGDPRRRRRGGGRVPGIIERTRISDAAGTGDARYRRHVHGGHPDHADRRRALWARAGPRAFAGGARRTGHMSAVPDPFIRLANLRKVYRKRDEEFVAISDVTFDVAAGELVSLVGPSGCGKTTLLKILAGLNDYDAGELRIGSTTHPFDPSRDIGMVFQQPLLLKWRRVLENVLLPAEILGLPRRESRERGRELLALVGLAGFEEKYPYELSGGMQQRAAIARALIHDPKLILMDEPFGALDALTRERMNVELHAIWRRSQKTIVFVTHGISEAVFLGTRVIVLTAGPARMADNIVIDLPKTRSLDAKATEAFGDYNRRIYRLLGLE